MIDSSPARRTVSRWQLAWQGWRYFWRSSLATTLGVSIGVAVLTGALLVGHSVRTSLRNLAVDRLGHFRWALVLDQFVRPDLARQAAVTAGYGELSQSDLVLFPSGTVESQERDDPTMPRRANGVMLYGITEDFWTAGSAGSISIPPGHAVLNEPLARRLAVDVGDRVVVRLATSSSIPADSPLARKRDRLRSLGQLTVAAVLPSQGLGRFTLSPTHQAPLIAFLPKALLQSTLEQGDRVNGFLLQGPTGTSANEFLARLNEALQPTLEDYGLRLEHIRRTVGGEMVPEEGPIDVEGGTDFWQLTTDRMIFDPVVEAAVRHAWKDLSPQPSLTYLATSIERVDDDRSNVQGGDASTVEKTGPATAGTRGEGGRDIPYSMVTAVDPHPGIGPLLQSQMPAGQPLAEDEILINRWTANEMRAAVGTMLRVRYFAPESTHGLPEERSATFRVAGIVELMEPVKPYTPRRAAVFQQPPTTANDPWLTPVVQGITDQNSIDDWDPPFPFDARRILRRDDDYWANHRTTPKAFMSLAAGRRLWGSRFGATTALRIPGGGNVDRQRLTQRLLETLRSENAAVGFTFRDLLAESDRAAQGTTPFDILFLLFSLFLIVAGLMLVALLLRLAIEQRAGEIGLWKSCGATTSVVARRVHDEVVLTLLAGSVLGMLFGILYAAGIIGVLRTWWLAAITTPFVRLHFHPWPVLAGGAAGGLIAWLTMFRSIRELACQPPIQLLQGKLSSRRNWSPGQRLPWLPVILLVSAVGMGWLGAYQANELQAGLFLGSGALLLAGMLSWLHAWLCRDRRSQGAFGLSRLAFSATLSDPTRTTLTIALTAWAAFLVVAVSLFRVSPTEQGTGGFSLWGMSDQPIFSDLNDSKQVEELDPELALALKGIEIFSLRLHAGEDASCRNLYRTMRPRIVGITDRFIDRYRVPSGDNVRRMSISTSDVGPTRVALPAMASTAFAWSDHVDPNPWERLRVGRHTADEPVNAAATREPIPVVLDQNTAMYALQLYGGIGQVFSVDYGPQHTISFRIVGLLRNSLLQGTLLVHERDLLREFPNVAGYQYFLMDCPPSRQDAATRRLEQVLGDDGMRIWRTRDTLAELLAVQNTYLSSFQSLGVLGLGLGTVGLAAVQLRSVLRRQAEIAVLAALGFSRLRIRGMVLLESLTLLFLGLATGTLAAVAAVTPQAHLTGTSFPVATLSVLLGLVLGCGTLASWFATRGVLRLRLLDSLRAP